MTYETYIGEKGYSIYKSSLTNQEQIDLRNDLMAKPYMPKSPIQQEAYPIYLESSKKIYVPKFYGLNKFGPPSQIRKDVGDTINLKFNGTLRPVQLDIVNKYLTEVRNSIIVNKSCAGGLLDLYCGFGKTVLALYIISQLKLKTLIIVHKGFLVDQWIERIKDFLPDANIGKIQGQVIDIENKDIVIGMLQSLSMKEYPQDQFNSFGFTIVDECFPYDTEIYTDCGVYTIGTLYDQSVSNGLSNLPKVLSYNTKTHNFEYNKIKNTWRKIRKDLIHLKLLSHNIKCTPEHKILTVDGYIPANKLNIGSVIISKYTNTNNTNTNNTNDVCPALNSDQLQIIYGSYLGVGYLQHFKYRNRYKLSIVHNENQIEYCKWKAKMFHIPNIDYIENNDYNQNISSRIVTSAFDLSDSFEKGIKKTPSWLLKRIDPRGIAIWLLDSGTYSNNYITLQNKNFELSTHDRFISKFKSYGINCKLKILKKTYYLVFDKYNSKLLLDLVRPYILPNYIIDKICDNPYIWNNEFLTYGTLVVNEISYITNRGVGVGLNNMPYVYDIEVANNHNFVLCNNMHEITDMNGPVVSNCHHISAEIFVRSLQKIITTYTLGLSATMIRKDGLTKVFKLFIGDIIHKEKRDNKSNLLVKAIEFNTFDEEFNTVEYDYRGNVKFSTMISKLCNFNIRSEFILSIVIKELEINNNQQIMILGHNKSLLVYLFKAIEHRKIESVGYYIGGMKKKDLKISETKKIIVATYSMAAEALDIKTLTTLVMASPKTDIEQAVGRILRVKDNNALVIDIIDSHDIFKKQWQTRKQFYFKNNYKIIHTDNYSANIWNDIEKKERRGKKGNIIKLCNDIDENLVGKCMISL